MPKPIPAELDAFLGRPNPAVIASLRPDGAPHSAATWYAWEDGRVLVNVDASRRRLSYLRRDPRVSITVMGAGDEWYRHVTLRGRVAEIEDDPDRAGIDRLSRHYTGQEYANREQQRVNAWIEVEGWHAWNGGRPWT
jgi:PPOX class probable F420-dependent enzyme